MMMCGVGRYGSSELPNRSSRSALAGESRCRPSPSYWRASCSSSARHHVKSPSRTTPLLCCVRGERQARQQPSVGMAVALMCTFGSRREHLVGVTDSAHGVAEAIAETLLEHRLLVIRGNTLVREVDFVLQLLGDRLGQRRLACDEQERGGSGERTWAYRAQRPAHPSPSSRG